jgi:hypothetical protein
LDVLSFLQYNKENISKKHMTNSTVPNIYPAMAQIVADIGMLGVSKDQQNSFQKFNYRSIDQMLSVFNTAFAKNKVFMIHQTHNTVSEIIGKDKNGANIWRLSFDLHIYFYSGVDGSTLPQQTVITGVNDGKDCSKLTGQLTSYLLKEAFFKQFLAPTQGADDLDNRDGNGIPLVVSDQLKTNAEGNRWVKPPKELKETLIWAATMLGVTSKEIDSILTEVEPVDGKKFKPFVAEIEKRWKLSGN